LNRLVTYRFPAGDVEKDIEESAIPIFSSNKAADRYALVSPLFNPSAGF
jgi:hypothetical protein